jgi:hypothetical protein
MNAYLNDWLTITKNAFKSNYKDINTMKDRKDTHLMSIHIKHNVNV